jgi:hypothetical protein
MKDQYMAVIRTVARRKLGDPNAKLDPPNISMMLDQISWACRHPDQWNDIYLRNIEGTIQNARLCLDCAEEGVKELRKLHQRKLHRLGK